MNSSKSFAGRRSVLVGLFVAVAQTVALAIAAAVTGSVALKTQTATNLADVAVSVFLLIGVVSSGRPPDDSHPLGYGRERFFWSLIAAVGIFIGGVGAAAAETLQAVTHPRPTGAYLTGYAVLAVVTALDAAALSAGLRPLRHGAAERHLPLVRFLWWGTDPAVTTVVLGSAAGVVGGLVAAMGLVGREITGRPAIDALAGALIGLILLATSVVLLHTNRDLLTGRSVPPRQLALMRALVCDQPGVVGVPDLFAIVVGPASLIVDADVVFDDGLDVPQVESIIVAAAAALRSRWPSIAYVYLNPVAEHRRRRYIPADPTDHRSRTRIGDHQVPVTSDRGSQNAPHAKGRPSWIPALGSRQASWASSTGGRSRSWSLVSPSRTPSLTAVTAPIGIATRFFPHRWPSSSRTWVTC